MISIIRRICIRHGETDFVQYRVKTRPGPKVGCVICKKAARRKWVLKNRDITRAQDKKYFEKNRDIKNQERSLRYYKTAYGKYGEDEFKWSQVLRKMKGA